MSKQRVELLFMRMNNAYGASWSNRYQTEKMLFAAITEWTNDLAEFWSSEIDTAYQHCKQRHQLAPTLPQFLALAKDVKASRYQEPKKEKPLCNKNIALQALKDIKAQINPKKSDRTQ